MAVIGKVAFACQAVVGGVYRASMSEYVCLLPGVAMVVRVLLGGWVGVNWGAMVVRVLLGEWVCVT